MTVACPIHGITDGEPGEPCSLLMESGLCVGHRCNSALVEHFPERDLSPEDLVDLRKVYSIANLAWTGAGFASTATIAEGLRTNANRTRALLRKLQPYTVEVKRGHWCVHAVGREALREAGFLQSNQITNR